MSDACIWGAGQKPSPFKIHIQRQMKLAAIPGISNSSGVTATGEKALEV